MEEQAKEYLGQIRLLNNRIKNLQLERENLIHTVLPGGVSYEERVQTSPMPDAFANWQVRVEEKTEEINQEIEKMTDLRLKITRQINQLEDPRYIRILYARYVELKKIRDIAKMIGYTYEHTRSFLYNSNIRNSEKEG